jgi:hypothetical protein
MLWWPSSLQQQNLVFLGHASILACCPCGRCYAGKSGPIRVKSILVVLFLAAGMLGVGAVPLAHTSVGFMLPSLLMLAVALLVSVNRGLAEAAVYDVDVAAVTLMTRASVSDQLTDVLGIRCCRMLTKVAAIYGVTFAKVAARFASLVTLICHLH